MIPGGVNSPVRACKSVGCDPLFVKKALGSKITDVDDNEFIDFVCSWGPMILGHNHPKIVAAIEQALANGTSYGAPTPLEIDLAELRSRLAQRCEHAAGQSFGSGHRVGEHAGTCSVWITGWPEARPVPGCCRR